MLLSPDYAGVEVWKVVLIESLMGIALASLLKANRDYPQLTLGRYPKTFAPMTFRVCVGIALIAVLLLKDTNGRKSGT